MVSVTSGVERWARDVSECAEGEAESRPLIDLGYKPFPKQQAFHGSAAKYRLFGGAAGPGKSKALLMEAVVQANEHTGVNTLLLRRTFSELEQSLLLYFRRDVPRDMYASFNETKHVVTWRNGSTTRFGYCQAENDVYQYQGAEFLFIGVDELTLFTLRQWQFLTSRNRCPVGRTFPCMAGATNPGNIGHAWVKALWIDKQPAAGMENPEMYDPSDYDFVPARVTDNPIYATDQNYRKTLVALPSHLRRAFLDGDWEVFAGQYFDRFDVSRHVVRAEEIGWRPWWPRWISIDWGFEHPAAVYWHSAAPASRGDDAAAPNSPRSTVVTYREHVTHRTAPRDLAHEIIERSLTPTANRNCATSSWHGRDEASISQEKIEAIYLSPDAFARRTDEASIADQMGDVFVAAGFPRPIAADNDRIGGWMLMYQMLDADEWVLTDNCIELIRTIPNLVRDMARVEDVEKMDGDDPADATRYGLKSRYSTRAASTVERLPYEARLAARIVSADPTVRAIQARRAQIQESRRSQPVSFLHRRR
ncbi:MAG: terminase family protein [Candidatus Acidiferrales bacterium]